MEIAPLNCSLCGAPIPGEAIDMRLGLARCMACNTVFDLMGRKAPRPPAGTDAPAPRPKVPLPERFVVEDQGPYGLRVSWRWWSAKALFGIFFCLFWDGFLVFWYSAAFSMPKLEPMMVLFPLIHVSVGIGLTYSSLAGLVNRTTIDVSRGALRIRHGPLPWLGNAEFPGRALSQLYSVEKVSTSRNSSTSVTYTLNAIDRSGVKRTLLNGLTEPEQVLWLEQTLERQLGIEDLPVEGELARRSA